MKKIAVFFRALGAKDYPFNKEMYWLAYQELDLEIKKLGAEFYIVRGQKTYLGKGEFSNSWKFKNGDLIETGDIIVDIIYNKGFFEHDHTIPVLNDENLDEICVNKWKTYQYFPKLFPKTYLVKNEEEFLRVLKKLSGDKKVVKPIAGEEGICVFIGDNEYLRKCPKEYPFLVQEFIDSSKGIPGIIDGLHDFRLVVLNGELIYSYVRTPPAGKYLANIAQGGILKIVDILKIPKSAIKILKKVDSLFEKFGKRLYSIDMAFSKKGPRIIELNSQVGLANNDYGEVFNEMKKKLARLLVEDR